MVNRLVTSLLVVAALLPAGCATRTAPNGQQQVRFDPRYLAKTEIDRVIDLDRAEVVASLRRLAEKLYRRNPREWKKSGQPGIESAVDRLFAGSVDFVELEGRREGAAAPSRRPSSSAKSTLPANSRSTADSIPGWPDFFHSRGLRR